MACAQHAQPLHVRHRPRAPSSNTPHAQDNKHKAGCAYTPLIHPAILPHLAVSNRPLRPNAGVQQSHTRNARPKSHTPKKGAHNSCSCGFLCAHMPSCTRTHPCRTLHTAKALHSKYTGTHQPAHRCAGDTPVAATPSTTAAVARPDPAAHPLHTRAHSPQGLLLL